MKTRTFMACLYAVVFSAGLLGCSASLSGSAGLSTDGATAILQGKDPFQVRATQPAAPEPPPPPPPPPPKKAKITDTKIEIMEKVQFAYNAAEILEVSNELLNDVADIMKEHVEVQKIRIEGHASSEGNAKYNKKLSDKRAKSVMDFLVKSGVEPDRMEAIGYGSEKPIADNATDEGKEKNRRVEFNILARLSKEEAEVAKAKKAEAEAAAKASGEASAEVKTDEKSKADDKLSKEEKKEKKKKDKEEAKKAKEEAKKAKEEAKKATKEEKPEGE